MFKNELEAHTLDEAPGRNTTRSMRNVSMREPILDDTRLDVKELVIRSGDRRLTCRLFAKNIVESNVHQ